MQYFFEWISVGCVCCCSGLRNVTRHYFSPRESTKIETEEESKTNLMRETCSRFRWIFIDKKRGFLVFNSRTRGTRQLSTHETRGYPERITNMTFEWQHMTDDSKMQSLWWWPFSDLVGDLTFESRYLLSIISFWLRKRHEIRIKNTHFWSRSFLNLWDDAVSSDERQWRQGIS